MIIVGVALASFVLGDFINPRKYSRRQVVNVGVIDGTDISGQEFNQKVEDNMELRRQNAGKESITPSEAFSIRQSVWQEMVSDILLGKQYDKLDINVSVDELDDQIRGNDPHQYIVQNFKDPQTGQFNPSTVTQFLQNFNNVDPQIQKRYLMLEKMIKTDRLRTKFNNLIIKGYYTPTLFAKDDYIDKNRKARIHIVALRYTTIPDSSVTASENDYKNYYEKHKKEFEQEASIDIDYVIFPVTPSDEDRQQIAKTVDDIYNQFKTAPDVANFVNAVSDNRYDSTWQKTGKLPVRIDSIMFNSPAGTFYGPYIEDDIYHIAKLVDIQMRPDSIKASHILISYQGARSSENVTRTKEDAKRLADSIYSAVKSTPSFFIRLALKYSDDPSVKQNNGNLDWFPDGMMVYEFNEACLKGKVGDIVTAETPFGYHVIEITGKLESVKKVRVAMIDRAITPSSETYQQTYLKANEFVSRNNTLAAFQKAVLDLGLDKRSSDKLTQMSNTIPGVDNPRQIISWGFNGKTQKGDVSQVFDMGNSYVVAALKATYTKGIAPLIVVRERIRPLVLREKKAEVLLGRLKESYTLGEDLTRLAQQFNTKVDSIPEITFGAFNIPGYGPELDIIGRIFSMKTGEVAGPIKGNQAVYIIALDQFTEPAAQQDFRQQKETQATSIKSRVTREVLTALEEKAKIVDNRVKFY
jgi:peptidyl-prolyl cis-trans isomerase D